MTVGEPLSDLLGWRLAPGSHDWPDPDGGTCVSEAAIVAAGFAYRAVVGTKDCPPCFSRPILGYLIGLNDCMEQVQRQRLIRFVPHLAGSADHPAVEQERHRAIVLETFRRIVSSALEAVAASERLDPHRERFGVARELSALAEAYRGVGSASEAVGLSYDAVRLTRGAGPSLSAVLARQSVLAARAADNMYEIGSAALAAREACGAWRLVKTDKAASAMGQVWDDCLAIAVGALALGRRAEPVEPALAIERMSKVRKTPRARPSSARSRKR